MIFDQLNSAIPDAVFLTHQQINTIGSGEHILQAPELAIEIVSPGQENARRDREVKRQVYGKHGVNEYWILDPERRSIEIYRRERHTLKLAHTLTNEDEIITPILTGLGCRVNQIFVSRSLVVVAGITGERSTSSPVLGPKRPSGQQSPR